MNYFQRIQPCLIKSGPYPIPDTNHFRQLRDLINFDVSTTGETRFSDLIFRALLPPMCTLRTHSCQLSLFPTQLSSTRLPPHFLSRFTLDGQPAIGYWIARNLLNRGIATRAISLFLELVQTRPLYAHIAAHNIASVRVLECCGFIIVGHRFSPADARYLASEEVLLTLSET